MEPIGRPPVAVPLLIAGKLALVCCWVFPLAGRFGLASVSNGGFPTVATGAILYGAGTVLAMASFASLGKSLAVGLPESATELKTGGVYRFSRNPIYLAAFTVCAGSCVIAPHPVNLGLVAIAAVIHHQIVLREERFLEARFGGSYAGYRRRVRRYIGLRLKARPGNISPDQSTHQSPTRSSQGASSCDQ
jgi:protein-S-isoprenylcysteine O-methyltransferase Ste14